MTKDTRRMDCPCCGGKPDSFTQWFIRYVSSPVGHARRTLRISPALRERCVDYALRERSYSNGYGRDTEHRAQEIANYIAGNPDQ